MELIEFVMHLDVYLAQIFSQYGMLVYLIIFMIIFLETGVVVAPFLPGDSLLFAAGALAAGAGLNIWILLVIIPAASILGDMANYFLGGWIGHKVFHKEGKILNKKNLEKAHEFYEKYGGWAIVLCRFFPLLRTFTPFVAGIGKMNFAKFMFFNILGGLLWGTIFLTLGYSLGNIPVLKENFTLMVMGIIAISAMPASITFGIHYLKSKKLENRIGG